MRAFSLTLISLFLTTSAFSLPPSPEIPNPPTLSPSFPSTLPPLPDAEPSQDEDEPPFESPSLEDPSESTLRALCHHASGSFRIASPQDILSFRQDDLWRWTQEGSRVEAFLSHGQSVTLIFKSPQAAFQWGLQLSQWQCEDASSEPSNRKETPASSTISPWVVTQDSNLSSTRFSRIRQDSARFEHDPSWNSAAQSMTLPTDWTFGKLYGVRWSHLIAASRQGSSITLVSRNGSSWYATFPNEATSRSVMNRFLSFKGHMGLIDRDVFWADLHSIQTLAQHWNPEIIRISVGSETFDIPRSALRE